MSKLLTINFTNIVTFKQVHDLLMEDEYAFIKFIEEDDEIDINSMFVIANLIQAYNPSQKIIYETFRTVLPTVDLEPRVFFTGIPFDIIILNGDAYSIVDGKIKFIREFNF